jgi:hypothetical protein
VEDKNGWKVLDREAGVACLEYKFGGGIATTLAFRGKGDGVVVVSPGCRVDAAALDALAELGRVEALVANNNFHWLGQPEWRKRFPEAKSYAAAKAIPRLSKKVPDANWQPVESLAPMLREGTRFVEPTGLPANVFAMVSGTGDKKYWYVSDLLSNIPVLPPGFIFKTLMSMTDSAPGYKLFRPSVWLQVKDKKGLVAWFDEQLTAMPPTTVVPAHGGPVDMPDLVQATRALVAKLQA